MTDIATPPPAAPTTFRFLRSRTDRRLGGVAGGLAVASGLDPALVRVAVVLAAFTGLGLLAYLVAWVALPAEDPAAGRTLVPAPDGTARFVRIALAVAATLGALRVVGGLIGLTLGSLGLLSGPWFGWGHHRGGFDLGPAGLLGIALIVWGVVVLVRRRDQSGGGAPGGGAPGGAAPGQGTPPPRSTLPAIAGPPAPPAPPGPAAPTMSSPAAPASGGRDFLLLLARVAGWLLALWYLAGVAVATVLWRIGALDLRWPLVLAATTVAVLGFLARTLLRTRRLGLMVMAAATLALPPTLALLLGQWDGRAGYRSAVPISMSELEPTYRHAVGQFDLDLSGLRLDPGTTTKVKIDMGAGEVRVTVPWEASVVADGRVGLGAIELFSQSQNGFGARDRARHAGAAGAGTLELSARARIGHIVMERAPSAVGRFGQPLACSVPEGGGLAQCRPVEPQPPASPEAPVPPEAPPAPGAPAEPAQTYLCKPEAKSGALTCFPT